MIAARLTEVRSRIATAARSAGRDPSSIQLIAVSKTFPVELVREAHAAGQRDFGENRVQEALRKIERAAEREIRWHLLGHLQTNKARKAGATFATIQSVDSIELLQKLDLSAVETGATPELLIQVEIAGQATRFGAQPADVPRLFEAAARLRAARVVGLMTPPGKRRGEQQAGGRHNRAPLSRDKPGRGRARRGSLDKPKTDADEPDEQAEDGHAREADRYPRVRRGIGKSLRRTVDSKRVSINALRVLDCPVADQSSDVGAGEVAKSVPPASTVQWLSLRQTVPLLEPLP